MTVHQPIAPPAGQTVLQLRAQDFLLLEDSGAFADYARAELLDGEIWVVNAIHSRHAAVQSELHGQIWSALSRRAEDLKTYLIPSLELGDRSLPEPDIVVAEPHSEGFLPLSKVRLVVEVSDTTLDIDLGRKQRIYAAAGIAEYWVADVNARVIHQMWSPWIDIYAEHLEWAFGAPIAAATINGVTIETHGL